MPKTNDSPPRARSSKPRRVERAHQHRRRRSSFSSSIGAGFAVTRRAAEPGRHHSSASSSASSSRSRRKVAQAVGARRRAAPRQVRRTARTRAVLDHSVHRHRVVVDRPARDHHELQRRGDAHVRHGAGERRRRALLDGLRSGEGRARGAGLRARRELGGADRAARHHRPHVAQRACCAAASRSRPTCRS